MQISGNPIRSRLKKIYIGEEVSLKSFLFFVFNKNLFPMLLLLLLLLLLVFPVLFDSENF